MCLRVEKEKYRKNFPQFLLAEAGVVERLARVEGILEQMDRRLNHIESDLEDIRADIRSLDTKIDRNFRWTLGILIPLWITIIVAIILK